MKCHGSGMDAKLRKLQFLQKPSSLFPYEVYVYMYMKFEQTRSYSSC